MLPKEKPAAVVQIAESYREDGVTDARFNIYAGPRHERLLETYRDQVYNDLREWVEGGLL